MGEVTTNEDGLLPRISSLFNNKMFSDVEFLFLKSNSMYGHKLILALRSQYFASMFYQSKDAVQQIVLPAEKRKSFYYLLRFIYTDDVQFQGVDVEDLFAISNQYGVDELASKCLKYMLEEKITVDNIFTKYECALNKDIKNLLRDCRNFVCREAQSVFESTVFEDASRAVVEDILKQDNLLLSSELLAINAVIRWGRMKCKKNGLFVDDKNLKECIYGLLKYLRFLTLSTTEFQSILEKYNIFTGLESTLLTCKILQPQCDVNVPEYISSSVKKRGMLLSNTASLPLFSKQEKYTLPDHHQSFEIENRKERNPAPKDVFVSQNQNRSNTPNVFVSQNQNSSNTSNNSSNVLSMKINRQNSSVQKGLLDSPKNTSNILSYGFEDINLLASTLGKERDVPNEAKLYRPSSENLRHVVTFPQSPFQYEIKKISPFANNVLPQHKTSRGQSTPNAPLNNISISQFPSHPENRRTYEFSLIEGSQSLRDSFQRDIKCSVSFLMKSGSINLFGFELYVKNMEDKSEKLEVDVGLEGFSGSFTKIYEKNPSSDLFSIMFSSPVLLEENRKGELEVSIDNLCLNRCRVCCNSSCELNNGSSCMCNIFIKSNQPAENQSGLYFLINRLFYFKPC